MGYTNSEDGLAYGDSHKETQRKAYEKDLRDKVPSAAPSSSRRSPRDYDPRRSDLPPSRQRQRHRPYHDSYSSDDDYRASSRMTAYRDDRRPPPSDYPGDSRSQSHVRESFSNRGRSRRRSPTPDIDPKGRSRSRSRMTSGYRASSRSPSWSPRRSRLYSRSPSRISSYHPDLRYPGPSQSRSNIPDWEGRSRSPSRGPPRSSSRGPSRILPRSPPRGMSRGPHSPPHGLRSPSHGPRSPSRGPLSRSPSRGLPPRSMSRGPIPMHDGGYFSDSSRSRSPLMIHDRPYWPESRPGSPQSRSRVSDLRRARSMSRAPTAPSVRFSPSPPPMDRRRPPLGNRNDRDRYAPSSRHGPPPPDPRYGPPPDPYRRGSWSRSPSPSGHSRRPLSPESPHLRRPPSPKSPHSSYRPRPRPLSVDGSRSPPRRVRRGSIDSIEDSYMAGPPPPGPHRRDYVGERRDEAVHLRRAGSPPYPTRPESRGSPTFQKPNKVFYDDQPTRPPPEFLRERLGKHDQQMVLHSPQERERAHSEYRRAESHRHRYSGNESSPERTPRNHGGMMQQVSRMRHERHSERQGSVDSDCDGDMQTVTRNEHLKAGRTKIPMKYVEESVILEQGYDYHVEGRAFIIEHALDKTQIDDLLEQSKVSRAKRTEPGSFDNTTLIKKKNGHVIERKDRESFHEEIILRPTPPPKVRPISMPPPVRHKTPTPPPAPVLAPLPAPPIQALPAPQPMTVPYPIPVPVPVPMRPDAHVVDANPTQTYEQQAQSVYASVTQGVSTGPPPAHFPMPPPGVYYSTPQPPPQVGGYYPPPPARAVPPSVAPTTKTTKTKSTWKYVSGPNLKTVAPPPEPSVAPTIKDAAPPPEFMMPPAPTAPIPSSSTASLTTANLTALSGAATASPSTAILSAATLSAISSRHRSRSRPRSHSRYRSKSRHSLHISRHESTRAKSRARSRSVGGVLVRARAGSDGSVYLEEDEVEKVDEGRRGARIEVDRKGQLRISRPKRKGG